MLYSSTLEVYTCGASYVHAEARKAPTVDGKVIRSELRWWDNWAFLWVDDLFFRFKELRAFLKLQSIALVTAEQAICNRLGEMHEAS